MGASRRARLADVPPLAWLASLAWLAACGATPSIETSGPGAPQASAAPPPAASAPDASAPAELPLPPSGKRMGAVPYDGGVEFRVWAPNAKAVSVVGEAAGPSGRRALAPEPGGLFAAKVDGARAGQRYQLEITAADGAVLTRLDPRARQIDADASIVVDPRTFAWKTPSFTPPARERTVVYEMHVGSFAAQGDGPTGTFTSAIGKLDALRDLGVNAVELMPVNGHGGHGWGYGPEDWFAPHPSYGAPDDLRSFVDAAHARGIAVVLDVVFNHYDGWQGAPLRCFDGTCPPPSAGIYFFEQDPYRATPWGPRPAFDKKEVSDFFADAIFAWTTEYRVDGFRQDSVSNIRALDGKGSVPGGADLMRRVNAVAAKARPGALLVAEDLKGEASVTATADAGGLGFDTQWDGGFGWAIASAVTGADDGARDLGAVKNALTGQYNGDPFERLLYVETHDTAGNDGARLPVKIDPNDPTSWAARKRSMLAAGLLFTAPGVPMIFMGQEMLESAKFEPQPAPLDWTKAATFAPVRTFFADMIRLRRDLDGGAAGLAGAHVDVTHLNDGGGNKVIAYRRWGAGGDDVMVVANFANRKYTRYDVGLPAGGAWRARVDGDDVRYGADFGSSGPTAVAVAATPRDGLPFTGSIALGPYSIIVLTR